MSYNYVTLEEQGGALRVGLNRPEVLNALSLELLTELAQVLTGPAAEDHVRAVLITGNGRGFCAGADLAATPVDGDIGRMLEAHYHPVVRGIAALRKPVIAGVNGVAAGAGLSLAAACDMRIASATATFTLGFTGIGLALDAGSSYYLSRLIGPGRTYELALTNRRVDASEALAMGLAERVISHESYDLEVMAEVVTIAQGPTRAFALVKEELRAALDNGLEAQLEVEARAQTAAATSDDAREGVTAFKEKRAPRYRGQ